MSDLHEMVTDAVYKMIGMSLTGGNRQPLTNLHDHVLKEVEPTMLQIIMEKSHHNQQRAAKMLGLSRGTLRKKLETYFGTRYFRLTED